MKRGFLLLLTISALAMLVSAGPAAAAERHTCSGTPDNPGVLTGTYWSNVYVSGVCSVGGATTIHGNLILRRGSALSAFTDLTVTRNVKVRRHATLVGGQDPDAGGAAQQPAAPVFHIGRNLKATRALGVVLHGATIDGNVTQIRGGGGVTCDPSGIFTQFGSPVFSVYEGSDIEGKLTVIGVRSCWLGITHSQIEGGVRVLRNQLADPDAIEILDSTIGGNLVCHGNSMTWDSADTVEGALYPRQWEPNRVTGTRVGQCEDAPPLTEGGTSPGSF